MIIEQYLSNAETQTPWPWSFWNFPTFYKMPSMFFSPSLTSWYTFSLCNGMSPSHPTLQSAPQWVSGLNPLKIWTVTEISHQWQGGMRALITRQWQERQIQLQMCPQPVLGKGDPFGCAFLTVLSAWGPGQEPGAYTAGRCWQPCSLSAPASWHTAPPQWQTNCSNNLWGRCPKTPQPFVFPLPPQRALSHQAALGAPGSQVSPQ